MSELRKRLIFFGALVIFFTISPLVVLFARGARFDFGAREINPTGGIYLKAYNSKSNYKAFLEGEKEAEVPVFISGLSPQGYNLKLKKKGYKKLEKRLCVEAYRVTKFRNILLIPTSPSLEPLEKGELSEKTKQKPPKKRLPSQYLLKGEEEKNLYFQSEKKLKTNLVLENITEFDLAPTDNKAFFKTGGGKAGVIWLQKDYWFNKSRAEIDFLNLESAEKIDWLKDGLHLVYQKKGKLYLQRAALRTNCDDKEVSPGSARVLLESLDNFRFDHEQEKLLINKEGQLFQYTFISG